MKITPDQKERYLTRRHEDLLSLKLYIESSDYTSIENIGHKLKGNGATFGFVEISNFGEQLELAARNKSNVSIQQILENLSLYLDSID